jgi:hypothetical protein
MATLLDYPAPDYNPAAQEAWGNKLLRDDSGKITQVRGAVGRPVERRCAHGDEVDPLRGIARHAAIAATHRPRLRGANVTC